MVSETIKNKESHELHIPLESEIYEKLEHIKEYYGIKNTSDVIRLLIAKKFRKIKKIES